MCVFVGVCVFVCGLVSLLSVQAANDVNVVMLLAKLASVECWCCIAAPLSLVAPSLHSFEKKMFVLFL